VEVALLEA
jgi:hypothetical protein